MLNRRQVVLAAAATLTAAAALARRRSAVVREIVNVVPPQNHVDGAGVKLQRALGSPHLRDLDPFLLLDGFHSSNPADYVAGFPTHPHRGFETVTILFEGTMAHADSVGNRGTLRPGAVQWMTAGRGILHSEFPGGNADGTLSGFQLWVNLPAARKWDAPRYQDIGPEAVPALDQADGRTRILAGAVGRVAGPVDGIVTAPTLLDVTLEPGASFVHELPAGHTAFVQPHSGELYVGAEARRVPARHLGVLGPGDRITLKGEGRFLLVAGAPIREPVARRGPFVMNTWEEIDQAIADHRAGRIGT